MNRIYTLLTAALVLVSFHSQAGAQGTFGQRNLGNGTLTPGQRTLTGTPGDRIAQEQQDAGQITGGERFLRENRQPGQFVGADTGDAQNFLTQFGAQSGAGGLGGLGGVGLENRGAAGDRNRTNLGQTGQTQRRPLRTTLRVAFRYRQVTSEEIKVTLGDQLERLVRRIGDIGDIEIEMVGRTAVLRGEVASTEDAVRAQRLAELQPGISVVQNELTVVPLPPLPEFVPEAEALPDAAPSPGSAR